MEKSIFLRIEEPRNMAEVTPFPKTIHQRTRRVGPIFENAIFAGGMTES
jgi:hypothetical protein